MRLQHDNWCQDEYIPWYHQAFCAFRCVDHRKSIRRKDANRPTSCDHRAPHHFPSCKSIIFVNPARVAIEFMSL